MKKIHILDFNEYSKIMCEQLHYLLEMGLDNEYQFVEVEMIEYALKLLIADLYNMSDVAIEKELEYPGDYIKLYEKELEEKKAEAKDLEAEIEELNKYYN
ncbi:hypothetical protein [Peptacetobacter sp. AB845]|uniref:hypothetical protein n=1 Tax=Peptacetobacter sp. AB845 TaxID=3388429 RepID=UPI0039C9F408